MKSGLLLFTILVITLVLSSCSVHKNTEADFYETSYSAFRAKIDDSLRSCTSFADSVICIRNQAHAFYRCGRTASNWQTLGYERAWEWSAKDWFTRFNGDSISAKCGGAASFLLALYKDYGFHSFTISIGKTDTLDTRGHVQTLVSKGPNCCPDLYSSFIMDAMFNFHYEAEGQLQSLGAMLDLIAAQAEDSLLPLSDQRRALYLQKKPIINHFMPEIVQEADNTVYKSRNSEARYLVSAPRSLERFLKGGFKQVYKSIIQEQGLAVSLDNPANFKYTVLAIRAVYSSCCNASIEQVYFQQRDSTIKHRLQSGVFD